MKTRNHFSALAGALLFVGFFLFPAAGEVAVTISREESIPGTVSLDWLTLPGRGYAIRAATDFVDWAPLLSPPLPWLATSAAMGVSVPIDGPARFFQVVETKSPYDPPWECIPPLRTLSFSYDTGKTSTQNGAALKAVLLALVAGDSLVIGAGTYSINSLTALDLQGTAAAPIRIAAAPGASVVVTRPDAGQNIINVGVNTETHYLSLHGLEFTNGSHGIRLYSCSEVWIDSCRIHDTGDVGLSANARDTSRLYITRNEIWDTGGTGEGMYLGGNNGSVIMSQSIIALNHVHDTETGVSQGDGIEVKQGSWGNVIAANLVHDCNYPCILVYGTAGQPRNIVENNICFGSGDNVIQVQGECIVRNNLVIAGAGSAFASQPHQGSPTELSVVHNTFVNTGTAARLNAWDAGTSMEFANNACYSDGGAALQVIGSTTGVTFSGNVSFGTVTAGVGGFSAGSGLGDFVDLSWDATHRDARPGAGSPMLGAGNSAFATAVDLGFYPREAPPTAGCHGP